jgi:hypothetical protein
MPIFVEDFVIAEIRALRDHLKPKSRPLLDLAHLNDGDERE